MRLRRRRRGGAGHQHLVVRGDDDPGQHGLSRSHPAGPHARDPVDGRFRLVIAIAVFTASVTSTLTTRKIQGLVYGVSDLARARVGVVGTSATTSFLDKRLIRYSSFSTREEGLTALRAVRLDAFGCSAPDSQWAAIRQLYFFMVVTARRHVFIQSPYLILDASLAKALRSAALSGVDVKVMLTARISWCVHSRERGCLRGSNYLKSSALPFM